MREPAPFLDLGGRAVLITGASSGIGRATAQAAARQGARVACLARREEELAQVIDDLEGDGHVAVPFDLTAHDQIPAMIRGVVDAIGPLDGLVHAAGIHDAAPLRIITDERIARVFDVNVTSAFLLAKAFRHAKVRGTEPSVVMMSSAVGLVGEAGVSVYAASKAAIASLTKSLGLELAREGIRVNCIAAGVVTTALTDNIRATVGSGAWAEIEAAHPLGLGTAEDVANAALFLLSPASRWITGTALVVDGGYTAR